MRNGVNHIDKQDFLQAYHTANIKSMSLANVQSSFAVTGLVPDDPERVLSKQTQFKTSTPTPPSSSHATAQSGPWKFQTPYNTTQLGHQAKAIMAACLSTPTNWALNQLVKGCQLTINGTVLLAEENWQLRREMRGRKGLILLLEAFWLFKKGLICARQLRKGRMFNHVHHVCADLYSIQPVRVQ